MSDSEPFNRGYCKLVGKELVPCGLHEWAEWFNNIENRRVKQEEVPGVGPDPTWVSTVCLGSDHGFGGTPKWFETCIFLPGSGGDVVERYETYDQAEEGHQQWVHRVWAGVYPAPEGAA